ncbi:hypothetical protein CEXT_797441 [Caerostris extrusa]|uniref:Uncharacterized protein n=1 Tax=Caerostris extrusa TaxID=172846 RepID=A0AAV4SEN3_CAEEX|nr:hypothetical protein CEXT_797441 [Caerostris extrusa]
MGGTLFLVEETTESAVISVKVLVVKNERTGRFVISMGRYLSRLTTSISRKSEMEPMSKGSYRIQHLMMASRAFG